MSEKVRVVKTVKLVYEATIEDAPSTVTNKESFKEYAEHLAVINDPGSLVDRNIDNIEVKEVQAE